MRKAARGFAGGLQRCRCPAWDLGNPVLHSYLFFLSWPSADHHAPTPPQAGRQQRCRPPPEALTAVVHGGGLGAPSPTAAPGPTAARWQRAEQAAVRQAGRTVMRGPALAERLSACHVRCARAFTSAGTCAACGSDHRGLHICHVRTAWDALLTTSPETTQPAGSDKSRPGSRGTPGCSLGTDAGRVLWQPWAACTWAVPGTCRGCTRMPAALRYVRYQARHDP